MKTPVPFMDTQENSPKSDVEFSRLLRSAAILVVDDEPGMRNFLQRSLGPRCALLEVAGSAEEAEALRLRYHFDVLIVDIRLPGLSGIEWMSKLRERGVSTHVIYMTAYADLDTAVGALLNGADDFIMKPFRTEQMLVSIRRTLMRGQISRENSLLRLQLREIQGSEAYKGESLVVRNLLTQAKQIAPADSCVLVQGEPGSGKSLLARTIHSMSFRHGPMVTVNCGALHARSDAAELFGEEGYIPQAHKGTLVLVDVEELSVDVQAQLVGFIDKGTFRSTGMTSVRRVDVRIIATTSVNLTQFVGEKRFRDDLLNRLSALPVRIPPLRDRGRDIELLVDLFMSRFATKLRLSPVELLHEERKKLSSYHWPGNVRELRNVVERTILLGQLPDDWCVAEKKNTQWQGPGYPLHFDLETVERSHIEAVLESVKNNKSAASRILGVSRKTLERKQALWYSGNDTK